MHWTNCCLIQRLLYLVIISVYFKYRSPWNWFESTKRIKWIFLCHIFSSFWDFIICIYSNFLTCIKTCNAVNLLYLGLCWCVVVFISLLHSPHQVSVEPLPRDSMTLYEAAEEQVIPTLGMCGDAAVEHLSWHLESRWTTQWWGGSKQREIEMEMWGCFRCTVGMTGVSSPHLPVAGPEIRKPSNVLCYTHLNGSYRWAVSGCVWPWFYPLCVWLCSWQRGTRGHCMCWENINSFIHIDRGIKVQAW